MGIQIISPNIWDAIGSLIKWQDRSISEKNINIYTLYQANILKFSSDLGWYPPVDFFSLYKKLTS
jgi:hypothetical protein